MIRNLSILLISLLSVFAGFSQSSKVSVVNTTTQLKTIVFNDGLVFVSDSATRGLFFNCASCTVDEENTYLGVGGKKWTRFPNGVSPFERFAVDDDTATTDRLFQLGAHKLSFVTGVFGEENTFEQGAVTFAITNATNTGKIGGFYSNAKTGGNVFTGLYAGFGDGHTVNMEAYASAGQSLLSLDFGDNPRWLITDPPTGTSTHVWYYDPETGYTTEGALPNYSSTYAALSHTHAESDITSLVSDLAALQAKLNGTGFVKASGTTISYDNSTYLTTSSASSTYQPLDADLTTIANLSTSSNDVILQVKSNAWTVRTPSQFKTDLAITKADVGLSLAENTAISTWAGSANINTLGTITTGVWNGTALTSTYLPATVAYTSAANAFTNNQTITKTTEQFRLAYDGTNYVPFTVNSSGDITVAATGQDFNITGNSTASFGFFSPKFATNTTAVNANFFTNGSSGTAIGLSTTNANAIFGGASNVDVRTLFGGQTTAIAVGNSASNVLFANAPITKGSSGTHAWFNNVTINGFTINTGSATVTNAASLYIDGAPTGATNNYSFYVNAGNVSLPSTTSIGDVSSTELGYADGVTAPIQSQIDGKVSANTAITGATKTKVTYDSKGLVTSGADAAVADITGLLDSLTARYTKLEAALQFAQMKGKHSWAAARANTTALDLNGMTVSTTGTATAALPTTTSYYTQVERLQYVGTATTANTQVGVRNNINHHSLALGFDWYLGGGLSSASAISGLRGVAGYINGAGNFTTASEPSAQLNCLFFGFDAGETQYSFFHNDGSGTCVKETLNSGTGFPTNTVSTDFYEFHIRTAAGSNSVFYEITNKSTGLTYSGTVTTEIPSSSTMMSWQFGVNNGASTGVAPAIDLSYVHYYAP